MANRCTGTSALRTVAWRESAGQNFASFEPLENALAHVKNIIATPAFSRYFLSPDDREPLCHLKNLFPTESGRDHGGKPYFYGTATRLRSIEPGDIPTPLMAEYYANVPVPV